MTKSARPIISIAADTSLRFEREQSYAMRAREWENRVPPLKGWGADILAGVFLVAFLLTLLIVTGA